MGRQKRKKLSRCCSAAILVALIFHCNIHVDSVKAVTVSSSGYDSGGENSDDTSGSPPIHLAPASVDALRAAQYAQQHRAAVCRPTTGTHGIRQSPLIGRTTSTPSSAATPPGPAQQPAQPRFNAPKYQIECGLPVQCSVWDMWFAGTNQSGNKKQQKYQDPENFNVVPTERHDDEEVRDHRRPTYDDEVPSDHSHPASPKISPNQSGSRWTVFTGDIDTGRVRFGDEFSEEKSVTIQGRRFSTKIFADRQKDRQNSDGLFKHTTSQDSTDLPPDEYTRSVSNLFADVLTDPNETEELVQPRALQASKVCPGLQLCGACQEISCIDDIRKIDCNELRTNACSYLGCDEESEVYEPRKHNGFELRLEEGQKKMAARRKHANCVIEPTDNHDIAQGAGLSMKRGDEGGNGGNSDGSGSSSGSGWGNKLRGRAEPVPRFDPRNGRARPLPSAKRAAAADTGGTGHPRDPIYMGRESSTDSDQPERLHQTPLTCGEQCSQGAKAAQKIPQKIADSIMKMCQKFGNKCISGHSDNGNSSSSVATTNPATTCCKGNVQAAIQLFETLAKGNKEANARPPLDNCSSPQHEPLRLPSVKNLLPEKRQADEDAVTVNITHIDSRISHQCSAVFSATAGKLQRVPGITRDEKTYQWKDVIIIKNDNSPPASSSGTKMKFEFEFPDFPMDIEEFAHDFLQTFDVSNPNPENWKVDIFNSVYTFGGHKKDAYIEDPANMDDDDGVSVNSVDSNDSNTVEYETGVIDLPQVNMADLEAAFAPDEFPASTTMISTSTTTSTICDYNEENLDTQIEAMKAYTSKQLVKMLISVKEDCTSINRFRNDQTYQDDLGTVPAGILPGTRQVELNSSRIKYSLNDSSSLTTEERQIAFREDSIDKIRGEIGALNLELETGNLEESRAPITESIAKLQAELEALTQLSTTMQNYHDAVEKENSSVQWSEHTRTFTDEAATGTQYHDISDDYDEHSSQRMVRMNQIKTAKPCLKVGKKSLWLLPHTVTQGTDTGVENFMLYRRFSQFGRSLANANSFFAEDQIEINTLQSVEQRLRKVKTRKQILSTARGKDDSQSSSLVYSEDPYDWYVKTHGPDDHLFSVKFWEHDFANGNLGFNPTDNSNEAADADGQTDNSAYHYLYEQVSDFRKLDVAPSAAQDAAQNYKWRTRKLLRVANANPEFPTKEEQGSTHQLNTSKSKKALSLKFATILHIEDDVTQEAKNSYYTRSENDYYYTSSINSRELELEADSFLHENEFKLEADSFLHETMQLLNEVLKRRNSQTRYRIIPELSLRSAGVLD